MAISRPVHGFRYDTVRNTWAALTSCSRHFKIRPYNIAVFDKTVALYDLDEDHVLWLRHQPGYLDDRLKKPSLV